MPETKTRFIEQRPGTIFAAVSMNKTHRHRLEPAKLQNCISAQFLLVNSEREHPNDKNAESVVPTSITKFYICPDFPRGDLALEFSRQTIVAARQRLDKPLARQ